MSPPVERAAQPPAQLFGMEEHELMVNEQRVPLSPLEFSLLRYLSERAGEAVPRGEQLEDV